MNNDKKELLEQLYSRLCFHCGVSPERYSHKRARFIASLLPYPDDLLCAAYHYISHHLSPARVPTEADFIAFMQPEFQRRQMVECMEEAV